jgi:RHS repeat-associated protein
VGFSGTVIKYWSCDGAHWNAYGSSPSLRPEGADCHLAKNPGPPCCHKVVNPTFGNPIHAGYGNKFEEAVDYTGGSGSPLRFARTYNSKGDVQPTTLGLRWRSNYDRSLSPIVGTTAAGNWVSRHDGKEFYFALTKNGVPVPLTPYDSAAIWTTDADIADRLTRQVDGSGTTLGWTYYMAASEDTETYDSTGRLLAITSRAGLTQTLAYNAQGLLNTVTDSFGRQLAFAYDSAGYLATMTDPLGAIYLYAHDTLGNPTSVTYPGAAILVYSYNEAAYTQNTSLPYALTGITDELGNRFATFNYNAHGDAISSEHAGGVDKYAVTYDYAHATSAVTDPLGTVRSYGFATILNVIRSTGISQPCAVCGHTSSVVGYDANGNVASRTDFNNKQICYAYDLTRNLETARVEGILSTESCATVLATPPNRPDVRKITTTWNATWRLPATINEPAPGGSKTTTFTYDASGNLTQKSIFAPKNDGTSATVTRYWNWTYGTLGRMLTAADPNGKITTYAYYADADANLGKRGNVQSITNPLGHVTQITAYDANARPLTTIDPNGLTAALTYDARGRLINRNVGGEQTTYYYDGVGQLTQVVLPDFSTLNYTYDAAHRLTQIQDGLGNKIVYTLDNMGNRTGEQAFDPSNALARTRTRAYDSLNRLAQDIGALTQTTVYGYDSNSNVTSVTDPLTHATGNSYDALNRLVRVLDPANGTTQYSYDAASNLTQVTDPRGLATAYTYDGLGNLTKQESPDTGATTSTFDAAGNVLTKVDARGVTATYTVDALNRVASVAYSKSGTTTETQTYTYDSGANAKGRLSRLLDTAATTAWTYTPLGRVASKTQAVGGIAHTLTYGYNAYGQLTSVTTPSGQVIGYTYTNNRVSGVTVNGSTLVSGVTVFPFGAAEGWQWGNAEFTFRRFDTDGRLASWEFRNGVSVLRNDLTFDPAGRITALADPNLPANSGAYQYDALDRLTVAQQGSPVTHTQQFAYDALGNRQNATIDGSLANLYYGAGSNQLRQLIGIVSPTYLGGATALAYTYNNANRMVQVQSSSTTLATYAVNGLGQRVQKVVGATTTRFVYDEQERLLGEYDGTGKLIQETVWLDDLPIATLRSTGATGSPTPINVYYVHADHLGSPRAVTRPADNAIMWRWDNVDPFGANAPNENPAEQGTFKYALRFPGQYYDAETGTHYNYFRDYDPAIGRYEQSDPIGLRAGPNTYGYVVGNPTRFTDPKGLWSVPPWCGILPGVACYTPPFNPIRPPSWWPDGSGCGDSSTDWIIPDTIFSGACKNHDRCYETCGMTKAACDLRFLMDMLNSCARNAWFQNCQVLAAAYYAGVLAGGRDAYRAAQRDCPGCR